jgi:hypothetical protein
MIKAQTTNVITKPNVNYRNLTALNYSMIKLFDENPVRFFEEFKLGKSRRSDSPSVSIVLGDLLDFYLLECNGSEEEFENKFDEKFCLTDIQRGTKQVYILADILFDLSKKELDENEGVFITTFEHRFDEACSRIRKLNKYGNKTNDQILEDFNNNGLAFFNKKMENLKKTVVEISMIDKVKKMAKLLLEDSYTSEIFNSKLDTFYKFPIEWEYLGIKCKSEVDILQIDHSKKLIYLRDLKTCFNNDGFVRFSYLEYKYYLQAAFYYYAVKYWAAENEMREYSVITPQFVAVDTSINNRRPIVFKTSIEDIEKAVAGFSIGGYKRNGLYEIVNAIKWSEENNIWNESKLLHDNNGVLPLNINYD